MSTRSTSREKAVTVDGKAFTTVVVLWWLMSLIIVRTVLETASATSLLIRIQQAVPAVQKYANTSGFSEAATAFYCYFLVTSPLVVVYYFRFTALTRPIGGGVKLIMWFVIVISAYAMIIGFDLGPTESRGFRRTFNMVLTSSWFGSSFIFLLFCHCLLAAIVCIAKDRERRFSARSSSE